MSNKRIPYNITKIVFSVLIWFFLLFEDDVEWYDQFPPFFKETSLERAKSFSL